MRTSILKSVSHCLYTIFRHKNHSNIRHGHPKHLDPTDKPSIGSRTWTTLSEHYISINNITSPSRDSRTYNYIKQIKEGRNTNPIKKPQWQEKHPQLLYQTTQLNQQRGTDKPWQNYLNQAPHACWRMKT